MQARHLIATEHMQPAADDLDTQRLVQTRGETLPAHLTQFGVETADEPDLARHRTNRRGAIGQEVEPGKEHQRAIGIGEGHRDRVRGERFTLPDRTLRLDPGRPLRRPALGQVRELRGLLRPAPRRGEDFATTDGVTEDRLRPMPVKTMIDAILGGLAKGTALDDLSEETPTVVETVAHLAQSHEPTLPLQRKGQRHRIEASAAVAFMDADRLRDRHPLGAEDAGEQRPFVGQLPASVAPRHLVVLITLVTIESAIQTRILRQQRRGRAAKSRRLLRVEIVDAVAIDESFPETRLLGMQRRLGRAELRRDRCGRERLLKRPQTQSRLPARARTRGTNRGGFAAGDPHIVNDAVATDRPIDEPTERQLLRLRGGTLRLGRQRAVQHELAVDPDAHSVDPDRRGVVVPLAIDHRTPRRKLATPPGDVQAEGAGAGVGLELPVPELGFMIAGDEHVVAGLTVEARPAFGRDRPRMELGLARQQQATRQGRTELRRERRHGLGAGDPTFRGRLLPGPVRRRRRSERLVQLRRQPSQPIEIILQPAFRIGVRVVEDPDRSAVTARTDLAQQGQVQVPRTQGLDLPSRGLAIGVHPVEVQAEQVGQQLRQELVEPLDDLMGVV